MGGGGGGVLMVSLGVDGELVTARRVKAGVKYSLSLIDAAQLGGTEREAGVLATRAFFLDDGFLGGIGAGVAAVEAKEEDGARDLERGGDAFDLGGEGAEGYFGVALAALGVGGVGGARLAEGAAGSAEEDFVHVGIEGSAVAGEWAGGCVGRCELCLTGISR